MNCLFCGEKLPEKEVLEKVIEALKRKERALQAELNEIAQKIGAYEAGYCGAYCQGNAEDPEEHFNEE